MNVPLFKRLLEVPTTSWHEQPLVEWLVRYVINNLKGVTITVDAHRNICLSKGNPRHAPGVAAHIDSVQPLRHVDVVEEGDRLIAFDEENHQVGFGADDKAGVYVCLELLRRAKDIRVIFFATEEQGCRGARAADASFFNDLGYLIEYDCPSRNMLSYTCSGVRLFANGGDFIKAAFPILQKFGTTLWQGHPYTDVMVVRERFPISCLNLSCGYYNWHAPNEFVYLPDVALAIEQGTALLKALGRASYDCPIDLSHDTDPLMKIGPLHVPEP